MGTLNASKVILLAFNLICRLRAVSVVKPSAQMSNFWTIRIFISESEPNFGFPPTHPYYYTVVFGLCLCVGNRQYSDRSCQVEEFTCDNGKCLPQQWKCNGVDECGDGTDERHCPSCE